MANRQPPEEVEEFMETSKRLESGDLPVIEAPDMASHLAPGEVVHHVSYPVFSEDGYIPGARAGSGRLFVTTHRLLFCTAGSCSSFPYADFDELEQEIPGFYVRLRGEHVLHSFFPPSLDPVFAAVVGALNNFGKLKTVEQA